MVLAEEWHTAQAVVALDAGLRAAGLRERASLLWNANNVCGFERIDWPRLAAAATITTVSRYMKQVLRARGVESRVIPNGLAADAFDPPERAGLVELRRRLRDRTVVAKMARFDPDKRWLASVDIVAEMKRLGWRPLLVARGGSEPHGGEVFARAATRGLCVVERSAPRPGTAGLVEALSDVGEADIVHLRSHVDPRARRVLFRGADAVLANSGHEPFGLVGLEAMAAGGLACTGCSGEDYAVPGQNALVLETDDAGEFVGLFHNLHAEPERARALRRHGQVTARRYAWPEVVERVLLPRARLAHGAPGREAAGR